MGREERRNFGMVRPDRKRTGSVVVGYPVGGSVTLPFHASVLRLLGYEMGKGPADRALSKITPYEMGKRPADRALSKITHASGLYVADNRMTLVREFLATGCDWLLQIDTDIEFPPRLIETMLLLAGSDKKILAASVPLGPYPSCGFRRTETPGVWEPVYPVPLEPIEVDGIATACTLIHRDVFLRIAERHGRCWMHHIYLPESPLGTPLSEFEYRSQGEDLAFSVRAAEAGFKVWVCHVPGLRHHKTRSLSHDDERALAMASEDDAMGELVTED